MKLAVLFDAFFGIKNEKAWEFHDFKVYNIMDAKIEWKKV